MKKISKLLLILFVFLMVAGITYFIAASRLRGSNVTAAQKAYYCPMHPNFTSDKPGDCAICGMKLVKAKNEEKDA